MDFDFNIILVPLTLAFGFIWLLDLLVWKQKRQRGRGKETPLVRWAHDFFPVLAVVLVVRSFLIEPFNIPSSSMVPTLYTGDYIAVNKYAYGLRLPLINYKFWDIGSPQHGDVAVFRYPENPNIYYIKRIIGLPGDTISFQDGVLSVNGQPIPTQPANPQIDPALTEQLYQPTQLETGEIISQEQAKHFGQQEEQQASYQQEMQNNRSYLVRYVDDINSAQYAPFLQQQSPEVISSQGTQWQISVPEGQYFVMGDNRDRSADSRFWGFVPDGNLAGKAVYIWLHKESGWHWPTFARNGSIE